MTRTCKCRRPAWWICRSCERPICALCATAAVPEMTLGEALEFKPTRFRRMAGSAVCKKCLLESQMRQHAHITKEGVL